MIANVTQVINCIDYKSSIYKTFPDGKRIMRFKEYVFYGNRINSSVFKIIDEPLGAPFVTDSFKNLIESNNITGFDFKLVWDSKVKAKS